MALNATLVRAYQNGEISVSNFGASPTLPTDATTPLSAIDYSGTGILTDAGVTESTGQEYNKIYGWQNGVLIATLPGTFEKSFKFAATQQSLVNLGLQYPGSTITQTAYGVSIAERAPSIDKRVWVIHGISGTILQRIVCPSGQITERGDVVWSNEEITVYEWTVELFPAGSDGLTYTNRYIVDPTLAL
jgi:hypothetical protein